MNQSSLIQEVIAVERAWVQAHRNLDIDALADLMADDYVVIDADGRTHNKPEDLAAYSTDRNWEFAESDEYDIRVYGDTAILIGRWRAKGNNNGAHFDYAARFASVYVKRNGRWRMVLAQSTPIPGLDHAGNGVAV